MVQIVDGKEVPVPVDLTQTDPEYWEQFSGGCMEPTINRLLESHPLLTRWEAIRAILAN